MAKPSWYYKKKADEADRRETYYRNRTPPEPNPNAPDPVVEQRPATTAYYRSMFVLAGGTDPVVYSLDVDNASQAASGAANLADLGLLAVPPAGTTPPSYRESGMIPSRISWYQGIQTPTRKTTAYLTTWTKYYDTTGGRSHYSVPVSDEGEGVVTPAAVVAKFNALFGGTQRTVKLGAKNGRATLQLERVNFHIRT